MSTPTSVLVRRRVGRAGKYLALGGYLVFLGFPLLWLLSVSFKDSRELASIHPRLIPQHFEWENYRVALVDQGLARSALNSLQTAVGATVLVILIAVPAAYALSKLRSPARTVTTVWILLSQVFPTVLLIIPVFLILRQLHLLNSLGGLTLVCVVWTLPFALWMMIGFLGAIPKDLEEAAAVDGAGRLRIIRSVVLPLLAPGIVVVAMFTFISTWNEFFFALVIIQDTDKRTITLSLANYVGTEGLLRLGPLAAGSVLATIPSLVFFAFLQRRIAGGMLSGAVKG
jgi:multiple sugar transport system permease protein